MRPQSKAGVTGLLNLCYTNAQYINPSDLGSVSFKFPKLLKTNSPRRSEFQIKIRKTKSYRFFSVFPDNSLSSNKRVISTVGKSLVYFAAIC